MMIAKKILLIEDEEALARILRDELLAKDYEVLHETDGEEGLRVALEEQPDMILLDVNLPGMNGVDVLDNIRGDEWGSTAQVMLLTNKDDIETISQVLEHGVTDYIVKSGSDMRDIIDKIELKLL